MNKNIIGEGSYGCVHKPSIHCKHPPSPGFNYNKYVSKIMKTKNAKKELEEFIIIKKIDPAEDYHLGEPILCKPNLHEANVKTSISKCKHINFNEFETEPDKYSLLVLKYGGPDLKSLCNKHLQKYLEIDKDKRIDMFWLEVHHLIKGLQFFKEHGLVHNDIKPQNILFNTTTGKLRYIDFGLMRTKQDIIDSSKNNNNYLGIYHWSYPIDCGLMDKQQYNKYYNSNLSKRTAWKIQLSELIVTKSNVNTLGLSINNPESFKILFTYLNPNNTIPNAATQYGYINSFFDGYNDLIKTKSYNKVLDHTIDSIDVYGLGFTLQFMANCFKRLNALSLENYMRLSSFFHKMYDFNPLTRVIDIDLLLNEYENILLENGILTRIGKTFESHKLVNKAPAPLSIMKESKNDKLYTSTHLSVVLQDIADKDANDISLKQCYKGKEFNSLTNKCVKKCKSGFSRKNNFKCRKKTRKANKSNKFNKSKYNKNIY